MYAWPTASDFLLVLISTLYSTARTVLLLPCIIQRKLSLSAVVTLYHTEEIVTQCCCYLVSYRGNCHSLLLLPCIIQRKLSLTAVVTLYHTEEIVTHCCCYLVSYRGNCHSVLLLPCIIQRKLSQIWNRTRPRALVQNQHTRELISARNTYGMRVHKYINSTGGTSSLN